MMFKKQQESMRGGAGPMNGGNNMSILNTNGPQQFDPNMINQVWIFILIEFLFIKCRLLISYKQINLLY